MLYVASCPVQQWNMSHPKSWAKILGVGGLDPLKYRGGVRVCFNPPPPVKMSHSYSKLLLDNSANFTLSRMKDLCQKWKVKYFFRSDRWLLGTGIVECLEIIDVGCNWKQFDGLTWLTLTHIFYDRSTLLSEAYLSVALIIRPHLYIVLKVDVVIVAVDFRPIAFVRFRSCYDNIDWALIARVSLSILRAEVFVNSLDACRINV